MTLAEALFAASVLAFTLLILGAVWRLALLCWWLWTRHTWARQAGRLGLSKEQARVFALHEWSVLRRKPTPRWLDTYDGQDVSR